MGFHRQYTRNRPGSPGSLGTVQRSIGYLQGGYKDVTVHSSVQLFNTNTQVGRIVYDTGYQRSYVPGIAGNLDGYFNINDTYAFNKFSYATGTAKAAGFTLPYKPVCSAYDVNIYSSAWIMCHTTHGVDGLTATYKLNLLTDAPTNIGNPNPGAYACSRQLLSGGAACFMIATSGRLYSFNYVTSVGVDRGINALFDTNIQIPCGMSVSNTKGYMVGMNQLNVRVNFTGDTPTAIANATGYTYHFGESHAICSNTEGFMMAGYSDTTGRYGGSQHGLCQKMNLTSEAIATLPDLVLPQSSGQMMQGF